MSEKPRDVEDLLEELEKFGAGRRGIVRRIVSEEDKPIDMMSLYALEKAGLPIPERITAIAKYNPKHELKSWVGLFEPIYQGEKKHELRVLDRDYQVGDFCKLSEYNAKTKVYTGRWVIVKITYITSGEHTPCAFSPVALHPDMGVLSIELLDKGE